MTQTTGEAIAGKAIRQAIQGAQGVLRQAQNHDGAWRVRCDYGPWCTAQVALALRFAGELSADEAAGALRYLRSQQRADGSFAPWPFARWPREGEVPAEVRQHIIGLTVCSTATAMAALHALGQPAGEDADAIRQADQFIEAHGGRKGLLQSLHTGQLAESSQLAALFLAMAGLFDLHQLPIWPLELASLPPVERFLGKRLSSNLVMMLLQMTVLCRFLRGDFGPNGDRDAFLKSQECQRCHEFLVMFQDPNGSVDDNTWQTTMALCAMRAMGMSAADDRFRKAVTYLKSQQVREADGGIWWNAFGNSVWDTVLAARALLQSGVPTQDPAVQRAIGWLVGSQLAKPQPEIDAAPGAPRTGGYAFERSNPQMPDCDDTGMVLGVLGLSLRPPTGGDPLDGTLAARVRESLDKGSAWLLGMQNPDGGWAAFQYGLPSDPHGLLPDQEVPLFTNNPLKLVNALLHLPVRLGDPAAADVTGRVLYGLGQLGHTSASPAVQKALQFLQGQQRGNHAWISRWQVNYLPGTASVLMGLAAVRADLREPWARGAIDWLLSRQNSDGGWGEDPESYLDEDRAGMGHCSMPPLTGLVLTALIQAGLADSPQVRAGIRYLLDQQRPDGTWPNADWLHSNLPPNSFYSFPIAQLTYPLEALSCYLASLPEGERDLPLPGRISSAYLDEMRQAGDPVADAVVVQVLQQGEAGSINALLAAVVRSDDPIPAGLPPAAQEYFTRTEALPPWADAGRIAMAQQLFVRTGWITAASLFCSSLPQAYAGAKGARVLLATSGMTTHVCQRVYETAQFLFDVMDPGALSAQGRGIRAAQKVRLMHAAIRHLVLQRGDWDPAGGVPINQEDLAGTLMTFSSVIIDALRRFRVAVTDEEAEAWQHTWNVVGHVLGIREELLPHDLAEAESLMTLIRQRQWAESPQGRELSAALCRMLRGFGENWFLTGLPQTMIRYLAGDHCADLLGLPSADWTQLLLRAETAMQGILGGGDDDQRLVRLFSRATHDIMKAVVLLERGGKQARFRIPAALDHDWNDT